MISFFMTGFSQGSCSSVELAALLERPLGGAAEHVDVRFRPGQDVAGLRFVVAGGQVVDLSR